MTLIYSVKTLSQNEIHSEIMGIRTSTYEIRGTQCNPYHLTLSIRIHSWKFDVFSFILFSVHISVLSLIILKYFSSNNTSYICRSSPVIMLFLFSSSYSSFHCCMRLVKVCIWVQQKLIYQLFMFLKENEYDVKDNKFINVYIIFF